MGRTVRRLAIPVGIATAVSALAVAASMGLQAMHLLRDMDDRLVGMQASLVSMTGSMATTTGSLGELGQLHHLQSTLDVQQGILTDMDRQMNGVGANTAGIHDISALAVSVRSVADTLRSVREQLGGLVPSLSPLSSTATDVHAMSAEVRVLEQQLGTLNALLGDMARHVANLDQKTSPLGLGASPH